MPWVRKRVEEGANLPLRFAFPNRTGQKRWREARGSDDTKEQAGQSADLKGVVSIAGCPAQLHSSNASANRLRRGESGPEWTVGSTIFGLVVAL